MAYDPSDWLCCSAVPGFPFKRIAEMTLVELQQTLCHILANEDFARQVSEQATHPLAERGQPC